MDFVVVDQGTKEKLTAPGDAVEIRDSSGQVLGYFLPPGKSISYEKVDIDIGISEEELDRRSKEGGGRSLHEIMDDLERHGGTDAGPGS